MRKGVHYCQNDPLRNTVHFTKKKYKKKAKLRIRERQSLRRIHNSGPQFWYNITPVIKSFTEPFSFSNARFFRTYIYLFILNVRWRHNPDEFLPHILGPRWFLHRHIIRRAATLLYREYPRFLFFYYTYSGYRVFIYSSTKDRGK